MRRRYAVNSKPITIVLNVLIVLVIAPLAVSLAQTTYYVNGTCGDDSWTGTSPVCQAPDGPKANIRPVLLATQNSDTVIVADGVYSGEQNTGLLFDGKLITVRSENGPILCIIDCQVPPKTSSPFAFLFSVRETLEAVLDGRQVRIDGPSIPPRPNPLRDSYLTPTRGDTDFHQRDKRAVV